jgi:TatD DNase family protein
MLVDSHCHLDRVELARYGGDFAQLMQATGEAGIGRMLCVSIDLGSYPAMRRSVEPFLQVDVSVGVHPTHEVGRSGEAGDREPSVEAVVALADDPRTVAIGETGLDYFRGDADASGQRERFRVHVAAARVCKKPLIIHTRDARADTLQILRDEGAAAVGGVLHCFTETWEMAKAGMDLGFYVSFSGIITFKSAGDLRDVARRIPLERLLIETDSPYLAPVPYRGKPNEPRLLTHVAACLAELRGLTIEEIAAVTGENYRRLFQPEARSQASTPGVPSTDHA